MFKGGAELDHCLICGADATCDFHGSPRCDAHHDIPSIDAPKAMETPRPYERGTPLPKDDFLKAKP